MGHTIGIIGTGFVADLYMRSLQVYPDITLVKAWDINPDRLAQFCSYWNVPPATDQQDILGAGCDLILNLTNPSAHYEVSKACLDYGVPVYSEKPLATTMADAQALVDLAASKGLMLASAPCNFLSVSAQTMWKAIREQTIGAPQLVYAELDDDYIPDAPYQKWLSESGAPWPGQDEFEVGCTLEHAGYYLTWLIAMFGPVRKLSAASAQLLDHHLENGQKPAPDFSVGVLFFDNNVVARLTCSILAPHDHHFRVIGPGGMLVVEDCWNNRSPVKLQTRHTVRRRLIHNPFKKTLKISGKTHPTVGRKGAASMNFMLGPAEMLAAQQQNRACRMPADFALHMNEVTLALQEAGDRGQIDLVTTCAPLTPMEWAQ